MRLEPVHHHDTLYLQVSQYEIKSALFLNTKFYVLSVLSPYFLCVESINSSRTRMLVPSVAAENHKPDYEILVLLAYTVPV